MRIISTQNISSRTRPVLEIVKLFGKAPVYDLDAIAEKTGFEKSSIRVFASWLALPKLNVRAKKKTYFFLTKKYLEEQFVPAVREIIGQESSAAAQCAETFPMDVFVESANSKNRNYLIPHDFTVSKVLTAMNENLYRKNGIRFSPVTVHFTTSKGNVEPDIISVFEPSGNETNILPVIFEIVQTFHSISPYFHYLFLKYSSIADVNFKLFANIIINDAVVKNMDRYIENISRKFSEVLKDKNPRISKKTFTWILYSKTLAVYIWKLSTALSDPVFNATIQSQVDFALQNKFFANPDIISVPGHHIERVEIEI